MSTLVWKELRHHARQWLWSLLVATVGGTVISLIITTWWSASQWAGAQPENAFLILAAHLIGSNLVTYVGLATTVVISTTLALTVAAQQRSHALWKVIGIPGPRIRSIILRQVSVVGVTGGLIGGLLAPPPHPPRPPRPPPPRPPGAAAATSPRRCSWPPSGRRRA